MQRVVNISIYGLGLSGLNFFYVQLNSGKVVAIGAGAQSKEGNTILVSLKEGDHVLLPEYGGSEIKLGDKE